MNQPLRALCAAAILGGGAACQPTPTPPPAPPTPTPVPMLVSGCPPGETRMLVTTGAPATHAYEAAVDALDAAGATVLLALPQYRTSAVCAPAGAVGALGAAGLDPRPDPVLTILEPAPSTPALSTYAGRQGGGALSLRMALLAPTYDPAAQWHLPKIDALGAWSISTGANVRVAIIDTGVACDHPGLAGQCSGGADHVGGRPQGPDLPGDGNGHGTHVAGIVAEVLDGRDGSGVAPGAHIEPHRVLDDGGSGWLSNVAAGVAAAGRAGMMINMSLGGPTGDPLLEAAIGRATRAGAIIVVARGNSGGTGRSYPVCYEPTVGVVATNASDTRAYFSDYGGGCADVGAPGQDIDSLWPGGDRKNLSGTSMAAPAVAGLVALLKSRGDRDPLTTIRASVDVVSDQTVTGGRVNAARAVRMIQPGPTVTAGPTAPPGSPRPTPTHFDAYPGGTPTPAPIATLPPPSTVVPSPTRTPSPPVTRTVTPTTTATTTPTSTRTVTPPPQTARPSPALTARPSATATPCTLMAYTRVGTVNAWRPVFAPCSTPTATPRR